MTCTVHGTDTSGGENGSVLEICKLDGVVVVAVGVLLRGHVPGGLQECTVCDTFDYIRATPVEPRVVRVSRNLPALEAEVCVD